MQIKPLRQPKTSDVYAQAKKVKLNQAKLYTLKELSSIGLFQTSWLKEEILQMEMGPVGNQFTEKHSKMKTLL